MWLEIEAKLLDYNSVNNLGFTRNLIKGRIAQTVFEMMFRQSGKYRSVLPFGYEYSLPELVGPEFHTGVSQPVLERLDKSPDFIMVSTENEVSLVEVKFRSVLDGVYDLEMANEIARSWPETWIFMASPKGFLFDSLDEIIAKNGFIEPLNDTLIPLDTQADYLKILNDFGGGVKA